MRKWMSAVAVCAAMLGCGGGDEGTPAKTPSGAASTQPVASPSTTAAQCKVLADRIDAFSADVAKLDAETAAGLQSLGATAMTASTDVGAARLDGDLAAIARDTSTYLADTSKKVVDVGTILLRVTAAGKSFNVESIKTCVAEPGRRIGAACKGKTSGDCPKVLAALDTWGRATKADVGAALAQFRALHVTEASVKPAVAEIVTCTTPLSDAFAVIDRDTAKLKELDTPDTREKDLDARFKTICGRGLFTK